MGFKYLGGSICAFVFGIISIIFTYPDRRDGLPLSGFSTKTAYRHHGLQPFHDEVRERLEQTCEVVHINAIFRHGTRAPSAKDMAKFQDLYNRLALSTHAQLPDGFLAYPIPFKNQTAKALLPMGHTELYTLGQKFRDTASRHFTFTRSNIRLFSSSVDRALSSGRSFYHGLFDLPPSVSDVTSAHEPRENDAKTRTNHEFDAADEHIQIADHLLRFFDYCERYKHEIDDNKSSVVEFTQFSDGPEMLETFNHLVTQHRLNGSHFSPDDLVTFYLACAYETAANPDSDVLSPWCDFIPAPYLPVLEYRTDLKQYWRKSYGYELNYLQSCPLVGEVLTQLRQVAEQYAAIRSVPGKPIDSDFHRASFWFGHAETLLPVVAALGLLNDSVGYDEPVKLRASNYEDWLKRIESRPQLPTTFRAGHIAPFAGNLALVLFYCPDSVSGMESDDPLAGFHVQPRLNGQTVAWPLASAVQPPTREQPGASSAPLSAMLRYFRNCLPGVYDGEKTCAVSRASGPSATF